MFYRLGRFSYRRRKLVLLAWFACFLASTPFIPRLPGVLAVGGFSNPDIESARARQTLEANLAAFYEDVERIWEQALRPAEFIATPLALLALVLVFGSVVGAAVPLVAGGLSVAVVLGIIYFLAGRVDMSIFVLNLATMLGLGLA